MKTVSRDELVRYLNQELHATHFEDSSLNGLQVEGAENVTKVGLSVDSGLSIVQEASRRGVNFHLVHHGLFWTGAIPVVGVHRQIISSLLESGINLFASHLPLDAHQIYGNNFGLARIIGLDNIEPSAEYRGIKLGAKGDNKLTIDEIVSKLRTLPGGDSPISALKFGPAKPRKVVVVTGAGADELYRYEQDGFDTLITGEPRQFAYHFCKERGLNAIFAGHYRTETVGVRLVGEEISKKFGVETVFIDEPTGI